jgi:thiosulfate/3-mercaptopyruvate sulfurtransferase
MTWQTLVSAEQVADRLGDPRLLVFDCRYELARPEAGREAYLRGHLAGAIHADLHHDLAGPTSPTSGRHPLPDPQVFAARLRRWGVDDDSLLLAYDDATGMWASRFWWMTAKWLRHRHVAVMNGGMRLAAARLADDDEPALPRPRATYRASRRRSGRRDRRRQPHLFRGGARCPRRRTISR